MLSTELSSLKRVCTSESAALAKMLARSLPEGQLANSKACFLTCVLSLLRKFVNNLQLTCFEVHLHEHLCYQLFLQPILRSISPINWYAAYILSLTRRLAANENMYTLTFAASLQQVVRLHCQVCGKLVGFAKQVCF